MRWRQLQVIHLGVICVVAGASLDILLSSRWVVETLHIAARVAIHLQQTKTVALVQVHQSGVVRSSKILCSADLSPGTVPVAVDAGSAAFRDCIVAVLALRRSFRPVCKFLGCAMVIEALMLVVAVPVSLCAE